MSRLIDLTGNFFGKLEVIRRLPVSYMNGEALWECKCHCSKQSIIHVVGSKLRTEQTTNCGCIYDHTTPEWKEEIFKRLQMHSIWNGECLEWTAFKDKHGYGKLTITKNKIERPIGTHRIMWIIHFGEIPEGLYVCHNCDNPSCIRIEHLFLGTPKENVDDKMNKGRHYAPNGEKSGKSKLKEEQVREILLLKGQGKSSHELSLIYGIAASTIRSIWQLRNWKHLNKD